MGSSAGQGRVPGESHDRCISGLERNMPWNPHPSTRPECAGPPPCPVFVHRMCDGFGNLTRLCPIVSVHLVVGRNKNHLDFFPDWMIRIYFLFLVLLLFLPHPPRTPFLSLLFFPFLSPLRMGWQGGLMLSELMPFPPSPHPTPLCPFFKFFPLHHCINSAFSPLPPYLGSGLLFPVGWLHVGSSVSGDGSEPLGVGGWSPLFLHFPRITSST